MHWLYKYMCCLTTLYIISTAMAALCNGEASRYVFLTAAAELQYTGQQQQQLAQEKLQQQRRQQQQQTVRFTNQQSPIDGNNNKLKNNKHNKGVATTPTTTTNYVAITPSNLEGYRYSAPAAFALHTHTNAPSLAPHRQRANVEISEATATAQLEKPHCKEAQMQQAFVANEQRFVQPTEPATHYQRVMREFADYLLWRRAQRKQRWQQQLVVAEEEKAEERQPQSASATYRALQSAAAATGLTTPFAINPQTTTTATMNELKFQTPSAFQRTPENSDALLAAERFVSPNIGVQHLSSPTAFLQIATDNTIVGGAGGFKSPQLTGNAQEHTQLYQSAVKTPPASRQAHNSECQFSHTHNHPNYEQANGYQTPQQSALLYSQLEQQRQQQSSQPLQVTPLAAYQTTQQQQTYEPIKQATFFHSSQQTNPQDQIIAFNSNSAPATRSQPFRQPHSSYGLPLTSANVEVYQSGQSVQSV